MTLTDPYREAAQELVKTSHRQHATATLTLPGVPDTITLAIGQGTVRLSEDWAPFQTVLFSCAIPTDVDLDLIDPRMQTTVSIRAGYIFPGGSEDLHPIATGHLRIRPITDPADTMNLEVAGAEAYCQDAKWAQPRQIKSFPGVVEALTWMIDYAQHPITTTISTTVATAYRPDLVAGVEFVPGVDMWTIMDGIALASGLRVYADTSGQWVVEEKPSVAGVTRAYLSRGATSSVESIAATLSRDLYYSNAVLTYTWDDVNGDEQTVVGIWNPANGSTIGGGNRTYVGERVGPISQGTANEAARLTVKNLSTRGNSYRITSPAMYWLRPGMTVQITLSDGTVHRHIIRELEFNLGTGMMTVTTREPSNLGDETA